MTSNVVINIILSEDKVFSSLIHPKQLIHHLASRTTHQREMLPPVLQVPQIRKKVYELSIQCRIKIREYRIKMSHMLTYNFRTRNPLIKRFFELGAISDDSSTSLESVLEAKHVTETVVNRFKTNGHVLMSDTEKLYLNVPEVRQQALRFGLLYFIMLEFIVVVIVAMLLFVPTVVPVPGLFPPALLFVGTMVASFFSYIEVWPFFYLRHSKDPQAP